MTALSALYQIIYARLAGGDKPIYPDLVAADTPRPYFVFFSAGGGNLLWTTGRQNARHVVTVKCVADTMSAAFAGASEIEAALRESGAQDKTGGLVALDGWQALTVTQDRAVHLVEAYQGAQPIYHEGHQYVFIMESV